MHLDTIKYALSTTDAPEVAITGYDDNWFVGRENVQLKCNAAANPGATQYSWRRYVLIFYAVARTFLVGCFNSN